MRFSSLIHERIQELAAKLPTQRNREFFERIMEIFRVTGNSRAKTEIRPRTNIFTIRDFDDGAFVTPLRSVIRKQLSAWPDFSSTCSPQAYGVGLGCAKRNNCPRKR